jgi:hypothetical protein
MVRFPALPRTRGPGLELPFAEVRNAAVQRCIACATQERWAPPLGVSPSLEAGYAAREIEGDQPWRHEMSTVEFLAEGLWARIASESRSSRRRHCAIAYVTESNTVCLGSQDVLVVDASEVTIEQGGTSAAILDALFKREVRLFHHPRLHAKTYVFDQCAIVGSSNLTRHSPKLEEAAILSRDPRVVDAARRNVERLASAGEWIDEPFIERIKMIDVNRQGTEDDHGRAAERGESSGTEMFFLETTPDALVEKELLRAYFVAVIQLQIGILRSNVPFRLWPNANVDSHRKKGRIVKQKVGSFILTEIGVAFFTREGAPRVRLLKCFLAALQSDDVSMLPSELVNRALQPLPGAVLFHLGSPGAQAQT